MGKGQVSERSQVLSNDCGTLFVVATPIGNLGDMSPRAIETLQQVDRILAEDTRHAARLLSHFAIDTPVTACHEHNEGETSRLWLQALRQGQSLALIADAGTPVISDPGFLLVRACHQQGIAVRAIPGASAVVSALSVSGLPSDRFLFIGFLPARSGQRRKHLQSLSDEPATLVFYESPHRIVETLADLNDIFGTTRQACLARELTKVFETVRSTTLADLREFVATDADQRRGEMVLLVAGQREQVNEAAAARETLSLLLDHLPLKTAAEVAAKLTGVRKKELYRLGLELKQASD